MKALLLALVLVASPALADPLPPRVCVPSAVLDRLYAYLAGQPWREAAPLIETMRAAVAKPEACPAVEPDKP